VFATPRTQSNQQTQENKENKKNQNTQENQKNQKNQKNQGECLQRRIETKMLRNWRLILKGVHQKWREPAMRVTVVRT